MSGAALEGGRAWGPRRGVPVERSPLALTPAILGLLPNFFSAEIVVFLFLVFQVGDFN